MKATYARRPVLRAKWYFDCACDRCCDPTECGSYLSALLCPSPSPSKPCSGTVLSCNPLSGSSDWTCHTCGALYTAECVLTLVSEASTMIDSPREEDDMIQHYERTIHHYSSTIHPSHYLIMGIKEKLAQFYGNFIPYKLLDLPRHLKERKIQVVQGSSLASSLSSSCISLGMSRHARHHLQSRPRLYQDKRTDAGRDEQDQTGDCQGRS